MRIVSFWAKGYRSLRDVRIDNLGPFNVFYGRNGSGKSNVLQALETLFGLARIVAQGHLGEDRVELAKTAVQTGVIGKRDLCAHSESRRIVLGAAITGTEGSVSVMSAKTKSVFEFDVVPLSDLTLEVVLDWTIGEEPTLKISEFYASNRDLLREWVGFNEVIGLASDDRDVEYEYHRNRIRAVLIDALPMRALGLVSAERTPRVERLAAPPESEDVVAWHLREGRVKSALFAAQSNPNPEVRRKLAAFRKVLAGPPLHRPPFDPVQDPRSGEVDLREQLPEPNPDGKDVSIDLAGLGIAQVYAILAQCMLRGARTIGIEEPEAHLHAPTSGKDLRQLLKRLVDEKYIDQLFIATHSNLFDLDETGYFDVSLKDGCTVIERAELTRIDRDHLYEPGPAKHALLRMLEYIPAEEVIFRRPDGSPILIDEMVKLLQEDDDMAVEFLKDLHGAAMRLLKAKTKRVPGA